MRTLAIVCAALALAGCATRIAAEDVDEAAARQAADADSRRFGFERQSEDYKQCMTTLARRQAIKVGFEAILRALKLVDREDPVLMVAKLTIDQIS